MPPMGPERDMYVDSMVSILVEEPKGGADPHWAKTGRNALSGFRITSYNVCYTKLLRAMKNLLI